MKRDPLKELHEQLTVIKDRVRGVLHGHSNGLYLFGRPGTSKTYSVQGTLRDLNVPHVLHNGHLTPVGLFQLLRDNPSAILVLDDVSSIISEPVALQILLAALGTPPDGSRTRTVRYRTARDQEVVRFTGGIVVITNMPLASHRSDVLAALKDRVHVIAYEPTDQQMEAFIYEIAEGSPRGVSKKDAAMVASFLLDECRKTGIRPSVRLFVDKALPDFKQWQAGQSQCHWKDLICSDLRQEATSPKQPLQDVSRKERLESERRMVLSICQEFVTGADRLKAWKERVGGSKSPFYRHYKELKKQGLLGGRGTPISDGDEVTPLPPSPRRKRAGGSGTMGLILN